MNRIFITEAGTDLLVFDGTPEQFKDCFFADVCRTTVTAWAKAHGFSVSFE